MADTVRLSPRRMAMATAIGRNAAWWTSSKTEPVHELTGQLRPFAFLFVLEVDVSVFPTWLVFANHARPLIQIGITVALVSKPEITVSGRRYDWRVPRIAVREAECEVPRTQTVVHGLVQPGRMTELKGRLRVPRQFREKGVEQGQVGLERRTELEQQDAQLRPKTCGGLTKRSHQLAAVAQPPIVRDAFGRLQGDPVWIGRPGRPALHKLLGGHPVERVVDFDRRESLGIITEHLAGRQCLGIEPAFPLRIVVTGSTDPNHHSAKCEVPSAR